MLTSDDIKNSALEAIYWWNRIEGFYNSYFSRLDELYKNKELFDFFSVKIFPAFLREYSVRRNITSGDESIKIFLTEVMESDFYDLVKTGKIRVIDEASHDFKTKSVVSNGKEIRSLLSKIAFLANPVDFSLTDSYAKESLWELLKENKAITKKSINEYSIFIDHTNWLITQNRSCLLTFNTVLDNFSGSPADIFFSKKPKAFERRTIDKYLWLKKATKNFKSVENSHYVDLYRFQNNSSTEN